MNCSFDTAIVRAILRGQEGLPPADAVRAFETIYWPAQRVHFKRDEPRAGTDVLINSDPALVRKRAFPV